MQADDEEEDEDDYEAEQFESLNQTGKQSAAQPDAKLDGQAAYEEEEQYEDDYE